MNTRLLDLLLLTSVQTVVSSRSTVIVSRSLTSPLKSVSYRNGIKSSFEPLGPIGLCAWRVRALVDELAGQVSADTA